MEAAWTKSDDEVLKYFDVQPELGLTKEQFEAAKAKYGDNELPAEEGKSLWSLIGK
jgi:Ca2+ transporting ATPase